MCRVHAAGVQGLLRPLKRSASASGSQMLRASSRPGVRSSAGVRGRRLVPPSPALPSRLPALAGRLALTGALVGPVLDSIHGTVRLLTYDVAPLDCGVLHTSAAVPPLLAALYATVGCLTVAADAAWGAGGTATSVGSVHQPLAWRMPASLAGCVALLALSAALHSRGVSPDAELAVLALCVFPFWAVVDRTVMTAVLAVLVALTAPACELLLMNGPGLWHYPTAENVALDFGGPPLLLAHSLPVWVAACYGGYTVWVAALARWLAVWS